MNQIQSILTGLLPTVFFGFLANMILKRFEKIIDSSVEHKESIIILKMEILQLKQELAELKQKK